MRIIVLLMTAVAACHGGIAPESLSTSAGAREIVLHSRAGTLHALEWPGSGAPLILLHGLGGNAASWAPIAPELRGRELIAIDLPGHGASDAPSAWDSDSIATQLVGVVRSHWPGEHVWVGHSWGGKVAVAAAAMDSASTRGLVLLDAVPANPWQVEPALAVEQRFRGELDPWPTMDSAIAGARRLLQYTPWTPAVEAAFRRAVNTQSNGEVVPLLTRPKGIAIVKTFAQDLRPSAAAIRAPVLVLSATASPFEKDERALFPSAEFVTIPSNHWLQINNPAATGAAIRGCLAAHH